MKKGRTLQELAAEIVRQQEAKRDFIAPVPQLEVVPYDAGVMLAMGERPLVVAGSNVRSLDTRKEFEVNNIAHGQLAEYAGIPKTYYDKLPPELLAVNVNHWLRGKEAGEKRMVRTLDGTVRALLSERYRPLDNADLAAAVLPVLQEQELFIASCEITERRMYIKAFDKRIEREIVLKGTDPAHTFIEGKKDQVYPAITISNSEVGYGSLSVAVGLFTRGCTNYAMFADRSTRKYHIGSKIDSGDSIYALLSDKTKELTDQAVWAQTRDVVRAGFEIARFEELVGRVQETTEQRIEGDVVKVVEVTSREFGFSKEESSSVLKHLISGGDLSRYGLFNAITRTAEDLADYERATDFEKAGGELIELPKGSWEKLARAA